MELDKISKKFEIRNLGLQDVDKIYALSVDNGYYYKHCPPMVDKESIILTIKIKPQNISIKDKHYIGYFSGNELVAVMDLIDGYPLKGTAHIGLFMMNKKYQNKGIGSSIISELKNYLSLNNYDKIRLAYSKNNKQAKSFWYKQGFISTSKEVDNGDYIACIMEYQL